jgi:NADH dehydrogenase FAD-containing subunit
MEANGRSEPARGQPHRVTIVSAGFGGLFAAKALRRDDVEVTVVDRTNHHRSSRCSTSWPPASSPRATSRQHLLALTGLKNRAAAVLLNWAIAFLGRARPQRAITTR